MPRELNPGYILHADPDWIDYHLANPVGRPFCYTRRVGAPMQNVAPAGHVFFLPRGARVKRAVFWGRFREDVETTPARAWREINPNSNVGAESFDSWMKSFNLFEDLTPDSPIRVLVFDDLTVPSIPVPLEQAGVTVVKNATKGWSIGVDEVELLIRFDDRLYVPLDIELDQVPGGLEGRRRLVQHLRIERHPAIVRAAKARWAVVDPMLRCECCAMSFRNRYGERGMDFIEAHHRKPLGDLKTGERVTTRIEDLAPVCANCHRMLHREPLVTVQELAAHLQQME